MEKRKSEWTKPAVIVSILALGATTTSAFSAFHSWRAADANLQVAMQNLEESGAKLEPDNLVIFRGDCSRDESVTVEVTVRNVGRTPTDLRWAGLTLRGFPSEGVDAPDVPMRPPVTETPFPTSADITWAGDVPVPAEGAAAIPVDILCSDLIERSLPTEAEALALAVRISTLSSVSLVAENGDIVFAPLDNIDVG